MSRNWLRRAVLVAASAASLLLAACGSGTIESQLTPARIIVFGDEAVSAITLPPRRA